MTFKLFPIDINGPHEELRHAIAQYLYDLPVGPRKYRDIQVPRQSIAVLRIFAEFLDRHGLEIVEKQK